MIDVAYDFRQDTPKGKDPDEYSQTLKTYHQLLWSKELPNGEVMDLKKGKGLYYLTWKNFDFGSDSIIVELRYGELELDKLFAVTDVTAEVLDKQTEISEYIDMLREYMEQTDEPQRDIGAHCFAPYSCGFFDYCTRDWPHPNIFNISSLQNRSKFKRKRIIKRCLEDTALS